MDGGNTTAAATFAVGRWGEAERQLGGGSMEVVDVKVVDVDVEEEEEEGSGRRKEEGGRSGSEDG
jgi:hypothetical protein